MRKTTLFLKKVLASLLLVGTIFSATGVASTTLLVPQKAEAVWGIGDISTDPLTTVWNWIQKYVWPLVGIYLKQLAIQFAQQEIIGWISGEKDTAAFITDFEAYIYEAADNVAGEFLRQMIGDDEIFSQLCNGKFNIEFTLYFQNIYGAQKPIWNGCSLTQVAGNVGEQLRDPSKLVTFSVEEGRAWGSGMEGPLLSSMPGNSQIFTFFEIGDRAAAEAAKTRATQANKAQAAGGMNGDCKAGQHQTRQDSLPPEERERLAAAGVEVTTDTMTEVCTPGRSIGDLLSSSIQSGFNLETSTAEQWSSFLTPILNAAIQKLLIEGISKVKDYKDQ